MIRHSHLVLMSAFLCIFTVEGVSSASTRMLVALMETFKATRAEAGLILSIMMAFRGFAGLFCGIFAQKFGARATCFVGSLVLAASFSVSFFATSVPFLIVTLGICAGTGIASIFVACTPTVCEHFSGRSLTYAITFMNTGASFGGMAYSYITGYLINQYGVRGTCLLIGGITLNTVAMTLLWNPNKINRSKHRAPSVSEHLIIQPHAQQGITSTGHFSINKAENLHIKQHAPHNVDSAGTVSFNAVGHPQIKQHAPRVVDTTASVPMIAKGSLLIKQNAPRVTDTEIPDSINAEGNQTIKQHAPREADTGISVSSNATENLQIQQTNGNGSFHSLKENLKSVFKDRIFMLFAFGEGLHLAVMMNARTYLVDTMYIGPMLKEDQPLDYGSLAGFLYSLLSLFGKFLFVIIKQIPGCSTLDLSLLSTVFAITGSLLIAFVMSITVRLVAWCLHGVSLGIYGTLLSVTTAKLLDRQHVAIGLGLAMFIRAVGSTIGGPLNGYLRDVTGTYTAVFICTSVLLTLGGILVSIARFNRRTQRRTAAVV